VSLSKKQKKLIKQKIKTCSLNKLSIELNVKPKQIENYLKKIWRKEKYQKFVTKNEKHKGSQKETIAGEYLKERLNFQKYFSQNWKNFVFLAVLVFGIYFNSLNNNFLSDDFDLVKNLPKIKSLKTFWQFPFFAMRSSIIYLIYKIFGLKPIFFRFPNIFFHLGSSLLIYFLLSFLLNRQVGLFTAAIFAVHPLQTEAVTWISGGPYSNSAFFALLSFIAYLFSHKSKKIFILSIFSYLIALSFSEKLAVFPLIFFFYEIFLGKFKQNWKRLIPFFLIAGLWSLKLLGLIGSRITSLQTTYYQQPGLNNPLVQIPFAITSYLELIFWPKNLAFYHSEVVMPLPEYIIRMIAFAIFLVSAFWLYKKQRRLFFWAVFFFIPLLPTLTPLRVAWVVAERYAYLATLGIYVIIAYGINQLGKKVGKPKLSWVIFAIILIALSTRTIIRNKDWKNQDTLWLATAKTSPSSSQNHNNLGDLYSRRDEFEKAIEEFKTAILLKPNYGDAYHNLANTYHQIEKDDLAIENYEKALFFNPNLWQSHQNLAAIYFNREQYQLSQQHLEEATKINPQNSELYTNLGIVYFRLNEKEKAKQALEQAVQLDPKNIKAQQALSSLIQNGGGE